MDELVGLCALEPELFCGTFFPAAFRQRAPLFHHDIMRLLEDEEHRYAAIEVFRGGAKTTLLRAYAAKRIAYGISRTILFVSESQAHSIKSLQWLRKAIEFNKPFFSTFGLEKGAKWTDELIEIRHRSYDIPITVVATGITGQVRGLNIDDYRPDLIIVDDPCNEENTATPEQREKTSALFFGALKNSLAPRSETPAAKMVLLQTSLHSLDLINACHGDDEWASRKYGIFTEDGRSRWEERFPTPEVLQSKAAYIKRNQLSIWLKEMECTAAGGELSDFREGWLKYWDVLPEGMPTFLAIDPVPPPTSKAEHSPTANSNDFECLAVVGVWAGNFYLLEYSMNRGHTPEWTVNEFFRLLDKWRPMKAYSEPVAYQSTLRWILQNAMKARGRFIQIDDRSDKRKKRHRILQALSGIASEGRFYIHRSMVDFTTQFASYPQAAHDDLLDCVSMAIDLAMGTGIDGAFEEGPIGFLGGEEKQLPQWRVAP